LCSTNVQLRSGVEQLCPAAAFEVCIVVVAAVMQRTLLAKVALAATTGGVVGLLSYFSVKIRLFA